ncbi:predicted protein [Postia placenta Mad-698-R]|nr:predicted protein [Postia placenta Mad-698-R]
MSGSLSSKQSFDAEVESIGKQHASRSPSHPHSIFEVVAALRVHALSRGNWYWVLPVCLLGMVPVGTNIWFLTQETWTFIPQLGCTGIVSMPEALYVAVVITTRASVIVSDILVVAATWYYICRTSAVREHLARGVWAAKPGITTVMFRNGTLYFMMTSILISHFLICIREAAERSIQTFTSQSLSFIDSQGNSVPLPWLSSIEFAADIANSSARDRNGNAFGDLEDDLDLRGEDDARDADNDAIELEPLTSTGFGDQVHAISRAVLFIHVLFSMSHNSGMRCQTEFFESALHVICVSCSELPKSVNVGDIDNMRYACLNERQLQVYCAFVAGSRGPMARMDTLLVHLYLFCVSCMLFIWTAK